MKAIIFLFSLFWGQILVAQQIARPQLILHLKNRPQIVRQDLRQNWQRNPDVIKQSLDSIVYQDWNETANLWWNSGKTFFEYDDFGRITNITNILWSDNIQALQNDYQMDYQYNADGDMFQYIGQTWDETNQVWKNDVKYDYQYNNHLLIEKEYSQWNDNTSTWDLSYKYEYTYDSNQNIVSEITYVNSSPPPRSITSWEPQNKRTYVYDSQQRIIERVDYQWDGNVQNWTPEFKITYSYTNGLLSVKEFFTWNELQQNWENSNRLVYTYNNNGLLTEIISQEWDKTTTQWVNWMQWAYYYDTHNNMSQEISRKWVNNLWENEYRYDYSYDSSHVYNDLILPKYYWGENIEDYMQSVFTHKLINGVEWTWDNASQTWITDSQYHLYFNPRNINDINENDMSDVNLYPNPVDNILYVDYEKPTGGVFELYNLTGQKLLSQPIRSAKQPINLQHIPSGLYLYHVQTDKGLLSGKLLKR